MRRSLLRTFRELYTTNCSIASMLENRVMQVMREPVSVVSTSTESEPLIERIVGLSFPSQWMRTP